MNGCDVFGPAIHKAKVKMFFYAKPSLKSPSHMPGRRLFLSADDIYCSRQVQVKLGFRALVKKREHLLYS